MVVWWSELILNHLRLNNCWRKVMIVVVFQCRLSINSDSNPKSQNLTTTGGRNINHCLNLVGRENLTKLKQLSSAQGRHRQQLPGLLDDVSETGKARIYQYPETLTEIQEQMLKDISKERLMWERQGPKGAREQKMMQVICSEHVWQV